MSKLRRAIMQAAAGATTAVDTGDDDFANVVLLLDGDGTGGDDNETFTDSGSVSASVTENGDCRQGSFSPYGNNWSNYFDGVTTDYLTVSSNPAFDFGTGDFTVECFFYESGQLSDFTLLGSTEGANHYFGYGDLGSGQQGMTMYAGSGGTDIYSGASSIPESGKWNHLVWQRSSGVASMYLNGTRVYNAAYTADFGTTATGFRVGQSSSYSNYYAKGYISNFRVVNGSAVYSGSTITVPTSPLTAVTDTKLLTCHTNGFKNGGTAGTEVTGLPATPTVNGTPRVVPFSPFKDSDARNMATDGGSVLFDSSGDYLQLPSDTAYNATFALCVECWFYMVGAPGSGASAHCPVSRWATTTAGQRAWFFDIENSGIRMRVDTATNSAGQVVVDNSTGALNRYAWYHIALTWDGSTYRGFLNGELIGSLSDSAAPRGTTQNIRVGYNTNSHYMDGYVSDVRILVDESPVYTEAFDPPTSPLGNLTGTAGSLDYVSYKNKNFRASTEVGSPHAVAISSDGTAMYVLNLGGTGTVPYGIAQYTLSTPYDASTASYASKSLSVQSQEPTPRGMTFKPDGTSVYVIGNTNDTVYEYTLTTAWDISTASYSGNSFLATGQTTPCGLGFNSAGTRLFIVDQTDDDVHQYDLSTGFDLSTATANGNVFDTTSQDATAQDMFLTPDGDRFFILGNSSQNVYQYDLSTAGDLSTASFSGYQFDYGNSLGTGVGLVLSQDLQKMYISGGSNDDVYEYDVAPSTTPTALMNFKDAGIFDRSGINNVNTEGGASLGFLPKYGTGSLEFDGSSDSLTIDHKEELNLGTADSTIEFWVAISTGTVDNDGIISKGDGGSNTGWQIIWNNTNELLFIVRGGSASSPQLESGTNTVYRDGSWHHVAITTSGTTIRMFLDGVQVDSYTDSVGWDSTEVLRLGTNRGNANFFVGFMDDVRITKGIARYTSAFTPPNEIDLSTDTYAEYVTLFLDGDGTADGQNNTFTDSSTNNFTITENGSVTQGVFSPYGNNWSNYFDSSSSLSVTNLTAPGTTFTVEFWVYFNDTNNEGLFQFTDDLASTANSDRPGLFLDSSGQLKAYANGGNRGTGTTLVAGQWYHIAMVRASSTVNVYVDGTSVWNASETEDFSAHNDLNIGKLYSTGYVLDGYLSNFRYVSGTAVYTANFTPPTAPLTAITNTELLTCQSNRFIDNSSNSYTVAVQAGTPKVSRFSPFESDKPYDITTDGGSAYFDGVKTTQLYAGTSNVIPATGDFTIEGWVYFTGLNTSNNRSVFFVKDSGTTVSGNRSFQAIFNNNGTKYDDLSIALFQTNSNYDVSTFTHTFEFNEWYHVAVTRTGQTIECFINGTSIGTDTNAKTSINQTTEENYIASWNSSNKDDTHVGYFGDFRIVHSRVYTSDFTPPTSPLGDDVTGTAGTLNYVKYENKSFSVSSQETNPQGVRFKSDGTKMYVLGNISDTVFQYSLSTAWDVSTASYDSVSFSVASQDSIPNGITFSYDGYEMYITGQNNNKIFQYDLSTAWDLSTASYANKSLSTQHTGPIEPFMRPNGTDFYYLDNDDDTVYQYTLSTANDISTASYASKSFSVASQETTPTGLTFSSDGTKMFVCGQVGDDVNQYTLSTAWDISTASFDSKVFSFTGETTNPGGIHLKPDDTKLYMISNVGDAVYQYSLTSSAVELLLNFQDSAIPDLSGINNIDTVGNAKIGGSDPTKYGSNAMLFDGTDDYLRVIENDEVFEFGAEDFTIEFWLYPLNVTSNQTLIDFRPPSTNGFYITIVIDSTSDIRFTTNSSNQIISNTISADSWIHFALCKSGTSTKMFINGTQEGSTYSDSNTYLQPERFVIGAGSYNIGGNPFEGFMDDLRITKGVARYTANFTAPDAALPKF